MNEKNKNWGLRQFQQNWFERWRTFDFWAAGSARKRPDTVADPGPDRQCQLQLLQQSHRKSSIKHRTREVKNKEELFLRLKL